MIGALAELKIHVHLGLRKLKVECERIRLPHPTRAGENLTGREKSQQCAEHRRGELGFPFHEIILVAAEGRAGFVIDIVFDEGNTVHRIERLEGRLQ